MRNFVIKVLIDTFSSGALSYIQFLSWRPWKVLTFLKFVLYQKRRHTWWREGRDNSNLSAIDNDGVADITLYLLYLCTRQLSVFDKMLGQLSKSCWFVLKRICRYAECFRNVLPNVKLKQMQKTVALSRCCISISRAYRPLRALNMIFRHGYTVIY